LATRTQEVTGSNAAHTSHGRAIAPRAGQDSRFRDHGDVPLLVDTASGVRRLVPDAFARWAATRTVFLSREMRELGDLRQTVSRALRDAGFSVVVFEDLGGRDEDAERAYLDGVARSDIYVGVVGDRYGTMLPTGRSPTHEE
jgi:Domain of unknown function (DUF4062)